MIIAFVPRWLLERLCADPAGRWHWNVVVSHAVLLMALPFAAALFAATDRLPHGCVARCIVDAPCPGCGITTGLRQLALGQLAAAWAANPAAFALAAGVPVQLLVHAVALVRRERGTTCNRISNRLNLGGVAALVIVWLARLC